MKKTGLLYLEIKEEIMKKIQEGTYLFEEKLPSEPELARELNVGRSTVREALKILQKDGVLISRNGVGTYVNKKSAIISNSLNRLKSLGQMIRDAGYKESESDIEIYTMPPEAEWAEKLKTDENVLVMERTRTADGQKVAFYYNILPKSLADPYIDDDFSGGILSFMEKNMGVKLAYAISEICAVGLIDEKDKKASDILGPGVILLKQLHFDVNGTPVLYSLDYLKSSVIKLFVKREYE